MKVRVRYHDVIHETDRAVLILISQDEHWFPKRAVQFRGGFITMPEKLAQEKRLRYKLTRHVPKELIPTPTSVIDELKYEQS